jgi:hypothetical protein
MFHIVFDARGAVELSVAMDMDDSLDGETVLIRDDYSTGPLINIFTEQGRESHSQWWSSISNGHGGQAGEGTGDEPDALKLQRVIQRMDQEEFDQIWIWVAPNAKDVCGYYWTISQLKAFTGRVYVLHLNNLPFINDKGAVFYPSYLSEIPPKEFVKARRLARAVSAAEFETDPDEWMRVCSENKNLRLLEGGKKLIQQEDDYFDNSLFNFLQPAFQKNSRILHQYLSKAQEKANETFLLWRLKQLVLSGAAEQQGEMVRQFVKAADEVSG